MAPPLASVLPCFISNQDTDKSWYFEEEGQMTLEERGQS